MCVWSSCACMCAWTCASLHLCMVFSSRANGGLLIFGPPMHPPSPCPHRALNGVHGEAAEADHRQQLLRELLVCVIICTSGTRFFGRACHGLRAARSGEAGTRNKRAMVVSPASFLANPVPCLGPKGPHTRVHPASPGSADCDCNGLRRLHPPVSKQACGMNKERCRSRQRPGSTAGSSPVGMVRVSMTLYCPTHS